MGQDIRYKHFENIKKCFKYVDRAVQEYIESMIKLNFVDDVTQGLYETLDDNKRGNPRLSVGYTATDGKYDTACLKAILNNCTVFDGWFSSDGSGWFQTFHKVGQVRNQVVGHNATQRIEPEEALTYFSTIHDMFPQLYEIFGELKDVEGHVKMCQECCGEINKISYATIDAILEVSEDPKVNNLFLLSKAILDAFCKFAVKKFVTESYIKEKLTSEKFIEFQKKIFLTLFGALAKTKISMNEKLLSTFSKHLDSISDWSSILQPVAKYLNITIGDSLELKTSSESSSKKGSDSLVGCAFSTFLENANAKGPVKADYVYLVQLAQKKNGTDTLDSNGTAILVPKDQISYEDYRRTKKIVTPKDLLPQFDNLNGVLLSSDAFTLSFST
ncbi:Oidioi.mRNA.OKI2018_I69.PAR.g9624.t1.cds [Oikopleura dioica]|uniref:Oidioi.mRNA.OKI2018_I69.PAR.g9624.t1.cds n=1 Tax=Oikopleura dioica TaxID=34765 RepID=A0ABN7RRV7_OIKDI|nr:Oidioi.mRNA.OKI2018_I69.PAR.g9624.t1.cds [Oikopleura dioica]